MTLTLTLTLTCFALVGVFLTDLTDLKDYIFDLDFDLDFDIDIDFDIDFDHFFVKINKFVSISGIGSAELASLGSWLNTHRREA